MFSQMSQDDTVKDMIQNDSSKKQIGHNISHLKLLLSWKSTYCYVVTQLPCIYLSALIGHHQNFEIWLRHTLITGPLAQIIHV